MTTLLQLNASIHSHQGESSQLADQFVQSWRARHADARVLQRDLSAEPVPHLTAERFAALIAKPEARSTAQRDVSDYSDHLIAELQQADVLVLGLPMYNFGVPSQLKAYFDHVARAGITFRYTREGPAGLLTGKQAYVFATRGGLYAGTALDSQSNYVRDFLRFLGIGPIEFVYAEGLAISPELKSSRLARASAQIEQLTAS